jgi:hypothetical protein
LSLLASEEHRRQQLSLRSVMLRELLRVWPTLNTKRLEKTYPEWVPTALQIIRDHHAYSSAVAQRFVDEVRAEAGVTDEWTPPAERTLDAKRVERDLYRAAIINLRAAIAKKQAERDARDRAFVETSGIATKEALNGGRDVVLDSVEADQAAVGWYRVTDGDPCYFCAMIASRGVWYKTEATASFHPHDHCGCSAAPAYSRDVELQPVALEADRIYKASTKRYSGKDKMRAFRRAWENRPRG